MVRYLNLGGNSSVMGYQILSDAIKVQFQGGKVYTYSYASAGMANVEHMKQLAVQGYGLCSFINRNVRFNYVK